jgi:hypothetical protein
MRTIALKIAGQEITTPVGVPSPGTITLESLISGVISLMITASVVLALFFIVYGGWLWINSAGDKDKIRHARMTIIYTLVGLAVAVSAMAAVDIVTTMLGLK